MFFCFVHKFFFGQHESQNIFFFLSRQARIFFPEFNIRLYDKNFESDYFFFLHPQEVKWSVPNDFSNGESVYINLQFVKNDMKIIILNIILRRYRSVLLFPKCKKKIKNIQKCFIYQIYVSVTIIYDHLEDREFVSRSVKDKDYFSAKLAEWVRYQNNESN